MNSSTYLRLDTREIAVVFGLFVLISLLMFSVGILVGKGLGQKRTLGEDPGAVLTQLVTPKTTLAVEEKKPVVQIVQKEPTVKTDSPKQPVSFPKSYSNGKYLVQVASYSTLLDATDRVQVFQKLGFPHAFSSAVKIGASEEVWYRVWLGFYPDLATAEKSGKALQDTGEIRNYLVRRATHAP